MILFNKFFLFLMGSFLCLVAMREGRFISLSIEVIAAIAIQLKAILIVVMLNRSTPAFIEEDKNKASNSVSQMALHKFQKQRKQQDR